MNATRRRLESARVAAVLVAAGSAAPEERALERLAEAIDAFARTGSFPPHPRRARLTWGPERPRTTGQEMKMPAEVHRGAEISYDIDIDDATTGARDDWTGVTATVTVDPPDAGELTAPDATGKGVFRPATGSGTRSCAVTIRLAFADGADDILLSDAVVIDPDVRVASIGWGAEQPRT